MPKKYEPTPEMLKQILDWYEETHNYSEVTRRSGLSSVVVKRIIVENTEPKNSVIVKTNNFSPQEHYVDWLHTDFSQTYFTYYSKLKQLSEELRANNGIL